MKEIKFCLHCGDESIRTIEQLRENFEIEEILSYYDKGILAKWLEVRGFDELKEVQEMNNKVFETETEKIKELGNVFKMDEESITTAIEKFEYEQSRNAFSKKVIERGKSFDKAKKEYFEEYERVIEQLEEARTGEAIGAEIKKLLDNFYEVFELDYPRIFERIGVAKSLFFLMEERSRNYFLEERKERGKSLPKPDDGLETSQSVKYRKKKTHTISEKIKKNFTWGELVTLDNFLGGLYESLDIIEVVRDTKLSEKTIAGGKGAKYMILGMGQNYVYNLPRGRGSRHTDYFSGEFMIVDRINITSRNGNDNYCWIAYMKVPKVLAHSAIVEEKK